MAPLAPFLRPSLLIIILVWLIHRTHTFTIKPIRSPSTYPMRFDNPFLNNFHRTAANMDSRREPPISDFQGRKTSRTRNNPSDAVLNYLHNLLRGRTPYDSIYNQIGKDLRQRLQVIVQEIADLVRSNSKQYRQNQRKNKKGAGYTVDETSSDFLYFDDEFPPSSGIETDDGGTGIYNREVPSSHMSFPFQQLPGMRPVSRTSQVFEPITEVPDLFRHSPPSPWSEFPPPDVTVTVKANQYEKMYHVTPPPRYSIFHLFRDLISRRRDTLSVSLNRTDSCTYIENVDNLGRIDDIFEWRIVIINSRTEEIWNSQCLPPDTVLLKFGYEVIITLQQRPGVSEDFILLSEDLEEEYEGTLEDLL